MGLDLQKLNVHTRASFVRKSVEENEITKLTIDAIMPYFPRTCQVIGGWVDVGKQYWKANFHWEYLLRHLDKAGTLGVGPEHVKCLDAIRAAMTKNKPRPDKGYTNSRVMGQPNDASDRKTVIARWRTVRQSKKDFKRIVDRANLLKGMSKKTQKVWLLALAPVARPGTSKHSMGYAVDIYGPNTEIVRISRALGASLIFPEGSHVHVEFANGVAGKSFNVNSKLTADAMVDDIDPHYTDDMCVLTPAELAELKLATSNAPVTGDFSGAVSYPQILTEVLGDNPVDIAH